MLKTLKAVTCALGFIALTAVPAVAGSGCGGGATTAGTHGSSEVAQLEQSRPATQQTQAEARDG